MSCHRAFQRPPLATCDVRQRDARFGGRPPIRVTEQAQYAVMIGEQLARRIEAESGTGPRRRVGCAKEAPRSEEHTSELQSLMRISYAVFCLKKKKEN